MIIIVGLGNSGEKFNNTRHNIGFEVVDFFAKKNDFPEFKMQKKYDALVSEKDEMILVKPQTFMNESGKTVSSIIKNRKDATLIVVHDDVDLPIGKLKMVQERGSAGHKGIESIIQQVGNKGLIRLRIGVANSDQVAKDVVLKKFTKEEKEMIKSVIEKAVKALDYFIENGLKKTMNEYNR